MAQINKKYYSNLLNLRRTDYAKKFFNENGFYPSQEELSAVVLTEADMEMVANRDKAYELAKAVENVQRLAMPIQPEGSMVYNLNGFKLIAPVFAESNGEIVEGNSDSYVFWVKKGAELVIEGDGEVVASEAEYSMAVWANGGKVTINGGKFYNNGDNSDLIYASNGSTVEIFGGEFHANENMGASGTNNRFPALNIKDKDRANTSIVVYGGKFFGFDPANNVSEGANTNFVAEGYKSIEVESGVFEVVKA